MFHWLKFLLILSFVYIFRVILPFSIIHPSKSLDLQGLFRFRHQKCKSIINPFLFSFSKEIPLSFGLDFYTIYSIYCNILILYIVYTVLFLTTYCIIFYLYLQKPLIRFADFLMLVYNHYKILFRQNLVCHQCKHLILQQALFHFVIHLLRYLLW